MEKLILQKIKQFDTDCFIGKIDPRKLVRVATKVEMGEVQDAQRPLSSNRVKEISKYVGTEKGILPINLTIATKDTRFQVSKETYDNNEIYSLMFPETDEEFSNYKDAIDVMDGQHRLYSFLLDYRSLPEDSNYEMAFTLYITPTLNDKQKIFISCNEKQQSVSPNLIIWFKEKLNMLTEEEKTYFSIVSKLSTSYPLKGHIIMSAEKISYGVKAKEVMAALKASGVTKITAKAAYLDEDTLVKVINTYLIAWENIVGFKFCSTSNKTNKSAGPAVKMAGLKYMIYLLPAFWDKCISDRMNYEQANIENLLKKFITLFGIERSEFFVCEKNNAYFRDASMVKIFADESIIKIKNIDSDFNPLGSL